MTADRKRQVLRTHACAVIRHAHERLAARCRDDLDLRRAGVHRILHQLLDHAGRPFNDFAGRDLVDHAFAKLPDLHETPFTRFRTASRSYMVRAGFVPILSRVYQI